MVRLIKTKLISAWKITKPKKKHYKTKKKLKMTAMGEG